MLAEEGKYWGRKKKQKKGKDSGGKEK